MAESIGLIERAAALLRQRETAEPPSLPPSVRVPAAAPPSERNEAGDDRGQELVLDRGRIVAQGTPQEVMTAPRQETVAQLAGFENIFTATVIAAHEDRGTMTCRIAGSTLELETPLVRAAEAGSTMRVGIRAGDILLAAERPNGLSARNILEGKIVSLEQRGTMMVARVDCGVLFTVHVTLGAARALALAMGQRVWLVLKTHSCHLVQE